MKSIYLFIIIVLISIGCNQKKDLTNQVENYGKLEFNYTKVILAKIEVKISLLSEKYRVSDTICNVLIYSYLKSSHLFFSGKKLPYDSILIKLEPTSILDGFSSHNMHQLINKLSFQYNVDKSIIAAILYDYLVLEKLDNLEDNQNNL
jgi:hypothetical protein